MFSFTQVDTNKDRLVTLKEFFKVTEKKEFLEPDSWEIIQLTSRGAEGSNIPILRFYLCAPTGLIFYIKCYNKIMTLSFNEKIVAVGLVYGQAAELYFFLNIK